MAKDTPKKIKSQKNIFRKMFNIFENNISLHEVSIDTIGSYAMQYDENTFKKLESIFKKKFKSKRKKRKITLSDSELTTLVDTMKKHPKQADLFAKNTLVSLVSTLDNLFAKIFEYYYTKNPAELSIENKQILFSDLKNIKNIEEAQKFLIRREVESLLINNGFWNKLKILQKELDISVSEAGQHMDEIKKLIKIRNLIVHNESRADEEFATLYGEEKIQKGETLKISQKYLKESLTLIYFIGGYILQTIQVKLSTNSIKSEEYILNDVIHRLIQKNEFRFLRSIYDVAMVGGFDDLIRKMIIINYCIGLKKKGKAKDHIERVLEKEDWSAASDSFQMAIEALKDNDEAFYHIFKKLVKNKTIRKEELREWEIFSFYKKKLKFIKLQKKLSVL